MKRWTLRLAMLSDTPISLRTPPAVSLRRSAISGSAAATRAGVVASAVAAEGAGERSMVLAGEMMTSMGRAG